MNKRSLLAVLAATFLLVAGEGSVFANNGWYAGAGVGVRPLSVGFSGLNVFGVRFDGIKLANTSPALDFLVGYRHIYPSGFMLGGEAFAELTNYHAQISLNLTVPNTNLGTREELTARVRENGGASILLGYQTPRKILFYSRLGVIIDNFHYGVKSFFTGFTPYEINQRMTVGGGQVGAGFDYPLTHHFSMRGEYTYTIYPHLGVDIPVQVPVVGESHVSFTPKAAEHNTTLSLLYHF